MADMVIHLIQETALGLALWPFTPRDEAAALRKLPEPMYPGAGRGCRIPCGIQRSLWHPAPAVHRGSRDLQTAGLQTGSAQLSAAPSCAPQPSCANGPPLRRPAGNHPSLRRVCFHAEDFLSVVPSRDRGWEWVNEGTDSSPKWGFVSKTPSSVLKVRGRETGRGQGGREGGGRRARQQVVR